MTTLMMMMTNMSRKNFYINLDKDGHMPILSQTIQKPCWIQYVNDTPVKLKPFSGMDRVWDYNRSTMLALSETVKDYLGKPMEQYKGLIL